MRKLPLIRSLKKRNRIFCVAATCLLLLASYPVLLLGYVWIKVAQCDLPGGRNGPLDAYRHTLASAVVAYTLDAKVVEWVSGVMEDEKLITHRMDIHNNRIGAQIGSEVKSFWDIEPTVARRVSKGAMFARDENQSMWLPESIWRDGNMW